MHSKRIRLPTRTNKAAFLLTGRHRFLFAKTKRKWGTQRSPRRKAGNNPPGAARHPPLHKGGLGLRVQAAKQSPRRCAVVSDCTALRCGNGILLPELERTASVYFCMSA